MRLNASNPPAVGNNAAIRGRRRAGPAAAALLETDVPIVAAVNGAAVGWGMELALMADLRVASEKAKFGELFVKTGDFDRLLVSELAHDDLTLSVRIALNEALYLRREAPARDPRPHRDRG